MSRQEKLAALASTGVTKAELDNIDGGTARGTTAIADGDGVLINDAGTMRMTSVETMATYIGTKVGGGMEFIASSGAISDAANVSFTQFDSSKYDHYAFYFQHVVPATDHVILYGYTSANGGTSYATTSGDYHRAGVTDEAGFYLSYISQNVGSDSGEYGVSGLSHLYAPHQSAVTMFSGIGMVTHGSTGGIHGQNVLAAFMARTTAEVNNAIRFAFSSGNIESGEITMFGIVNS